MKRTLTVGKEKVELEFTRINGVSTMVWNGEVVPLDIREVEPRCYSVIIDGKTVDVSLDTVKNPDPDVHAFRATLFDGTYDFQLQDPMKGLLAGAGGAAGSGGILTAPMPGKVVKILVAQGDRVEEGQTLLILEAMKMQNDYKSTASGRIKALHVAEGAAVETGASLVTVEAVEE
ncbi:MAG: biotin/lipoyl-binding protein [Acidobacteria bacterium]|nr:biotin/lipoyl-binding protein [Acidobacteriota bacterium]